MTPNTATVSTILDELEDVISSAREMLADGKVTLPEIVTLGIEIAQLGAALFTPLLATPEVRAARKTARIATREARRAARK